MLNDADGKWFSWGWQFAISRQKQPRACPREVRLTTWLVVEEPSLTISAMAHISLTFDNLQEPSGFASFCKISFELIGVVIWPLAVLLIVSWLRGPLHALLSAAAKRLEDKDTDLTISEHGVSLTRHQEATEGRVDVIQAQQEQIRYVVLNPRDETNAQADPVAQLKHDVAEYESKQLPNDKGERVRLLNEVADRMGVLIYTYKLRDKIILEDISTVSNGVVAGMASSIVLGPRTGDAAALLRVAPRVTYKHTKYRVALAVIRIAGERGYLSEKEQTGCAALIDLYAAAALAEDRPDQSLLTILARTKAILRI